MFLNIPLGQFEVVLCIDNSESSANRKYVYMYIIVLLVHVMSLLKGQSQISVVFCLKNSQKMVIINYINYIQLFYAC